MRKLTTTALAALCLLASMLSLAACSGDRDDEVDSDPASEDPTNQRVASAPDLPTPPEVEGGRGGIGGFAMEECATDEDEHEVEATMTGLTGSADYLVQISWIDDAGHVHGRGFKVLHGLRRGKEKRFTIKADVAAGATQCAPSVLYGQIDK